MLVINPMTADARVDRAAVAIGRTGRAVTVVAVASEGQPEIEDRVHYQVIRLPYSRPIKDATTALRTSLVAARQRAATTGSWDGGRTQFWRSLLAYILGGAKLKVRRSSMVWEEYWLSIGSKLPELLEEPSVIHAHDLGPLFSALAISEYWGGRPKVIYDSHELFTEQQPNWKWIEKKLWKAHERSVIGCADAVVTVSDGIARELKRRYRLSRTPRVVYNSPEVRPIRKGAPDVRSAAGIGMSQPLVVYVGHVKEGRGVPTLIAAAEMIPELHIAFVGTEPSLYLQALLPSGPENSMLSRIHMISSVPSETLPEFLRTADLGVHPMERTNMNHELAMPNKLFDYVFAGLPVVASDLQEMGTFVKTWNLGSVFEPGDADGLREAIETVLAWPNPASKETISEISNRFGWKTQAGHLRRLYDELEG
jgi:glycosyltransferase involved in cell wall biosynthesis